LISAAAFNLWGRLHAGGGGGILIPEPLTVLKSLRVPHLRARGGRGVSRGGGGGGTCPVAGGTVCIREEVVGFERPALVEGVFGVDINLWSGVEGIHATVQVYVMDELVKILVPAQHRKRVRRDIFQSRHKTKVEALGGTFKTSQVSLKI
jgi:hypothetical protein